MSTRRDTLARTRARIGATALLLAGAVGISTPLASCGAEATQPVRPSSARLVTAGHGSLPGGSRAAARLARRFAAGYADCAYRRQPPSLPGESPKVRRILAAAAVRVPTVRRGLRPRLLDLRISAGPDRSLVASARIGDGRFPSFSVSFTLTRRSGGWLVTSFEAAD